MGLMVLHGSEKHSLKIEFRRQLGGFKMTKDYFAEQINRLVACFGDRYYNTERNGMIWREVCYLPNEDFKSIVDDFIADMRTAPTRKDFVNALTEKRLKNYQMEKKARAESYQSEPYLNNSLNSEQISTYLRLLRESIQSGNRREFTEYEKTLPKKSYSCKVCRDEGDIRVKHKDDGYETYFKCFCPMGDLRGGNLAVIRKSHLEKYEVLR